MTVKWFGRSWGAPVCDPEDHEETPLEARCGKCDVPIHEGKQRRIAYHLDCWLKKILPHGPDCKRCRGMEHDEHKLDCRYRVEGDECSCCT